MPKSAVNTRRSATTTAITFHIIANQLPTVTLDQPSMNMTVAIGAPVQLAQGEHMTVLEIDPGDARR